MSIAELDRSGSRTAKPSLLAPGGVIAALRLVTAMALPIGAITAVFWGLAYLAYRQDPNAVGSSANLDMGIVGEQVRRAAESPPADLAFVGDSSCLFGIDPATLRKRFPGKSIENFCTSAWVGPAGYGIQIKHMVETGKLPHSLVLYFNPIQFSRYSNWDGWVDLVRNSVQGVRAAKNLSPTASLDYVRRKWLARAFYQPVWGFSLYYGSFDSLLQGMRSSHGVLVNPAGLGDKTYPGEDAQACRERPYPSKDLPYKLAVTAEYERALSDLAQVLRNLDRGRVYLMIAPAPVPLWPEALSSRNQLTDWVADKLGLDPGNIIRSPVSFPNFCFTDGIHPNRRGRILLTRALAEYLPPF